MKQYTWSIEIAGRGETPEEAWEDACQAFANEARSPDEEILVLVEDE